MLKASFLVGMDVSVNYDDNAYIYFVSDVSSSYTGFTVEYRIGCRTFEYIPASNGLFDMILGLFLVINKWL